MSMLDRIRDSFKYLDKNGLKHLVEKIKAHDVHWTGTHAEYEAQKDNIPAYAILHFTDDYEDSVGVVDVIEDNNMNGVTSNAVYDALSIESHNLLANTIPADTAVTVAQITVPKGKWMIFGQLHTQPFTSANNLLSLAISVNGTAALGETVDQRRQVAGIWGFAHGMLLVNPTAGPETVKLVGVVQADTWQGTAEVGVIKAEIVAVKVAD